MDNIDKLLNATKVLRESIPILVDVFTMYYGEDNKEYIEKKFNDLMILGFQKNEVMLNNIDRIFSKIKSEEASKLIKESFEEYDLPFNDRFINYLNLYNYKESLIDYPLVGIKNYIEGVKLDEKYNEIVKYVPDYDYRLFNEGKITDKEIKLIPEKLWNETNELLNSYNKYKNDDLFIDEVVDDLSFIIDDVNVDNIDDMIHEGKLDKIYELSKTIISKREKEYEQFCSSQDKMNNIISYFEKEEDVRKRIHDKHYLEFVSEFKDLLSKRDQNSLERISVDNPDFDSIYGLDNVLPNSLDSSVFIEYFKKEYDDKLGDPNTPQFLKDTIEIARKNYFNYKGIDLGINYSDYINDPLVKEKWPSEELIDKIKKSYLEHREKYQEEIFNYYLGYAAYKKSMEEAEEIGLLNKEALFSPAFCLQDSFLACVYPNVVKDGDDYKLFSQVSVGLSSLDYLDESIVHELNHVYEMILKDCDGKKYTCVCGWDEFETEISQDIIKDFDNESEGKYTAFNEIINELIAQQITKMMHQNGVYIFSEPENAKEEWASGYQYTAFLVNDFFKDYYDTIIASRRDNNIELIWDKVGKENFDELNDLFHEYHELFPGACPAYLEMDLRDKKDTILTRNYNMLKGKRDKILDNMKEYSVTHSAKLD